MVMKLIFGSMLENIINSVKPKNVIFVDQPLYMQHNTNLNNSHLTIDGHARINNELQSYNQPDLAPHLSPSPGTYGAIINDNINNSVKPVDYGIHYNQDLLKNNSIVDQPNIINNDNFQSPINNDFSSSPYLNNTPEPKDDIYNYNNRMSENDKPLFGYDLSPKNHDIHFHGRNENEITHAHYKEHGTHKRFGYLNGYEASMEDHNLFEEGKKRYDMYKPIEIKPPEININPPNINIPNINPPNINIPNINPPNINPPNINPPNINPPEIKNSLFYSNNDLYDQLTNHSYDD